MNASTKTAAQAMYCGSVLVMTIAFGMAIAHALDLDRPTPWTLPLGFALAAMFPMGVFVRIYFGKTSVSKVVACCILFTGIWFGFVMFNSLRSAPSTVAAPTPQPIEP